MLTKYVMPGEKVEISTINKDREDRPKKVYSSTVFDLNSDEEIKIVMPMEQGRLILLPIGQEYDLCFYTKSGLFQAYATVKDRYKSNNIYVVTMELTSNLRKHQRREYYRLNCVLSMKCTSITDEQEVEIRDHQVEFLDTALTVIDGTIVDISGGGVRFISKNQFNREDKIQFSFSLNASTGLDIHTVVGVILSSNELEKRPGEYENRAKFLIIDNDERESIIKYIFEEQRKIRRRSAE